MANTLTTFMSLVASRFNEKISPTLKPHAAVLSAIHINPTPETMPPNRKVTVPLLSLSAGGVDALTTAPALRNVVTAGTELELNYLYSLPFAFTDVQMSQVIDSPGLIDKTIREVAMDCLATANAQAAAKLTTTNYSVAGNTTRTATSAAGAEVTATELGTLRTVLSKRKIPINDRGNLFMITDPIIYGKWLTNSEFAHASTLGDEWASILRSNGDLRPQFNFLPLEDPQMPITGTTPEFTYTTAAFHRNAMIMVNAPLPRPTDGTAVAYLPISTGTPGQEIIMRITSQFNQNIGATGGAYTSFLAEAFMGFHVHDTRFCALHTTVLDNP